LAYTADDEIWYRIVRYTYDNQGNKVLEAYGKEEVTKEQNAGSWDQKTWLSTSTGTATRLPETTTYLEIRYMKKQWIRMTEMQSSPPTAMTVWDV